MYLLYSYLQLHQKPNGTFAIQMNRWMNEYMNEWNVKAETINTFFCRQCSICSKSCAQRHAFKDDSYTSLLNFVHIVLSSPVSLSLFTFWSVFLDLKVEVYVNGIPAKCSGDCGFTWDPMATPLILTTTPSEGNTCF